MNIFLELLFYIFQDILPFLLGRAQVNFIELTIDVDELEVGVFDEFVFLFNEFILLFLEDFEEGGIWRILNLFFDFFELYFPGILYISDLVLDMG